MSPLTSCIDARAGEGEEIRTNMNQRLRTLALTAGLGVLMLSAVSGSDRWPQFRGLEAGAVADDPALPDTWSTTQNVMWSLDVPGLGWSSPVVWGDQIFITSVISSGKATPPQRGIYPGTMLYDSQVRHRWMVYSVDLATGKIRWQQEIRDIVPPGPKHLKNSFASETPVTDGERVYVHFANIYSRRVGLGRLACSLQAGRKQVQPRAREAREARPRRTRRTLASGF
jgi:outer membrane protein assembly factor BamB